MDSCIINNSYIKFCKYVSVSLEEYVEGFESITQITNITNTITITNIIFNIVCYIIVFILTIYCFTGKRLKPTCVISVSININKQLLI